MKFGIIFANTGPFATPEGAVAIAQSAEEAGFESLWTVEHVLVPKGYQSSYPYSPDGKMPGGESFDIPDPLIWLSYIAGVTKTIRLATGILILPQRQPGVVAKEVATLDKLSGGRVELGVGAGWLEEEFGALGVPFERRGERLDDYIAALRGFWTDEAASHHSDFLDYDDCVSLPKPVNGTIPIHIGGHTKVAARRAGRLGDGFFPGRGDHQELAELIELVRKTAVDHGRDPDAIEITTGGNGVIGGGALDEAKALTDLGVSRAMIPPLAFDPVGIRDALLRYGDEVISKVSD